MVFIHIRYSKKEINITTVLLEPQRPESCEDTGFAPIGLDEPYRVIISEDPIGFKARDLNLFRYVGNNPANWIDPLGLIQNTVATEVPSKVYTNPYGFKGMIGGVLMAVGGALVVIPDPPYIKMGGFALFGIGLYLSFSDDKETIDKKVEETRKFVDGIKKMTEDIEKDIKELERDPYQKKKDCP